MSADTERSDRNSYESLNWMLSTDDRLLAYFDEHGPELCPQAAGVLGLHVPFAQRRCETLCRHGFLHKRDTEYYMLC